MLLGRKTSVHDAAPQRSAGRGTACPTIEGQGRRVASARWQAGAATARDVRPFMIASTQHDEESYAGLLCRAAETCRSGERGLRRKQHGTKRFVMGQRHEGERISSSEAAARGVDWRPSIPVP